LSEIPAAVRQLVEGANHAYLATVLPDGRPHSVPPRVGLEGDRIAFLTSLSTRKARNVAHDPRVAISITDRDQLAAADPPPAEKPESTG
jgi:general stress protein 26